jgi:hypothetical protein
MIAFLRDNFERQHKLLDEIEAHIMTHINYKSVVYNPIEANYRELSVIQSENDQYYRDRYISPVDAEWAIAEGEKINNRLTLLAKIRWEREL